MKIFENVLFGIMLLSILAFLNSSKSELKVNSNKNQQPTISNTWENPKIKNNSSSLININGLIKKIDQNDFIENTDCKAIPQFIKLLINSRIGDFVIANPNENWNSSDVIMSDWIPVYKKNKYGTLTVSYKQSKPYPSKQLNFFGKCGNMAILAYSQGGDYLSRILLLFEFDGTTNDNVYRAFISDEINSKGELL